MPRAQAIVADKGYDSERIREQIEAKGSKAVIPRRRNSVRAMPTWTEVCIDTGTW